MTARAGNQHQIPAPAAILSYYKIIDPRMLHIILKRIRCVARTFYVYEYLLFTNEFWPLSCIKRIFEGCIYGS